MEIPFAMRKDRTLHRAFEIQAAKTPNAAALIFKDEVLSYRKLNQEASHLARTLKERLNSLGTSKTPVVLMGVEEGFNAVIAAIAALKAEVCYIPIDPLSSAEHIEFILNDSDASIILCEKHFSPHFKKYLPKEQRVARLFALEDYQKASLPKNYKNFRRTENEITINSPACIIYAFELNKVVKKNVINHIDIVNPSTVCPDPVIGGMYSSLLSGKPWCLVKKEDVLVDPPFREKDENSPPIKKVDRGQLFPLSFSQKYFWQSGNVSIAIRFLGNLNISKLKKCCQFLILRHEILRTVFKEKSEYIYQEIKKEIPYNLEVESVNKFNLSAIMAKELHCPFEVFSGNLMRLRLFKLDKKHHVLLINQNGIISDNKSINILLRELNILYLSKEDQWEAVLGVPEIQYADFAVWQNKLYSESSNKKQENYWQKKLENYTVLNLPTTYKRPKFNNYNCKHYYFYLGRSLLASMNLARQKARTTLFNFLLAVFGILLGRYSAQQDILIGTLVTETHKDTLAMIGCFANMLALRIDLSGSPNFLTVLERVKQTYSEACAHQDLFFEHPVDILQLRAIFLLDNAQNQPELAFPDIEEEVLAPCYSRSPHDITFRVSEGAAGLNCDIAYNMGLFSGESIAKLAKDFEVLLKSLVKSTKNLGMEISI